MVSMGNDEIGVRIRRLRERAGVQAKDLAEALGIDASGVSNIESGKRAVKTHELAQIARTLGISSLAILEPNSLLARLPVAARSSTTTLDQSVHDRLTALAEIHAVLSDSSINAVREQTEPPKIDPRNWWAAARELAAWAAERIKFDDERGRFESLATSMEDGLGIDVLVEECDDSGALGAAITDSEFPFVYINANQPRARALFTLAHELGHVLARDGATLTVERDLSGINTSERLANAFASELLMPQAEIEEILKSYGKNAVALGEIMKRFQVSFESMVYRLHNLGIINAEGRDNFLSIRFGGLLAQLDSPEDRAGLLELRATLDQKRPPRLLIERLLRGYSQGIVSVRPLAEMLNQDPDDLIELLSSQKSESLDFTGLLRNSAGPETSQEDRFAGQPA
jgi:Zn-dependent peptidase ImmA (M78 family)